MQKSVISTKLTWIIGCLVTVAAGTSPVSAKIKCNGPYQVVKGAGEISTPYCEDSHLASIAREYGMRVSAQSVRQNPGTKDEVCRLVGHDPRTSHTCAGTSSDYSNGRR